jgi:predicted HTH domain antitoxin
MLQQMNLSEDGFRVEVATLLYDREVLSMGQAIRFSGLDRIAFQKALANRKIAIKYTIEDLEEDLLNLRQLRDEGSGE